MVNIRKNGVSRNSKSDASNKNMSYDDKDKLLNIGRSEIRYVKEIDPDMSDTENQNDDDDNNKRRLSFNDKYYKKKENDNINITHFRNEIIENDLMNNKDKINDIDLGLIKDKSIKRRENTFQRKKYDYALSPQRADPFADKSPSPGERTYTDIMLENKQKSKMKEASRNVSHFNKQGDITNDSKEKIANENNHRCNSDDDDNNNNYTNTDDTNSNYSDSDILRDMKNEKNEKKKKITNNLKSKWDVVKSEKNNLHISHISTPGQEKWTENSSYVLNNNKKKKISRWDKISKEQEDMKRAKLNKENNDNMNTPYISDNIKTPYISNNMNTPYISNNMNTPYISNNMNTPYISNNMNTPYIPNNINTPFTPMVDTSLSTDALLRMKIKNEIDIRNRPLTDEDLDELLPSEGYEIVQAPEEYEAIRNNKLKNMFKNTIINTPLFPNKSKSIEETPYETNNKNNINNNNNIINNDDNINLMQSTFIHTPFYELPNTSYNNLNDQINQDEAMCQIKYKQLEMNNPQLLNELKYIQLKNEDYIYFSKLFETVNEEELSQEELKERKFMILLLKIKNGTPSIRRTALRSITEKVKELGPETLFNLILPLMMQNTLEDQERHLLVKVIDRILFKLDDLVRPYVHKILVVIEPLLIDEDYYARVEGREIISNLAKAAGLATMIGIMRPDIDHPDEYVRNTTARAFAVVASALGIPSLILFLKAVCQSKKNWEARHTGIKIVQQIAILMGCAVLPHLKDLVQIIAHGLHDEQQKVRTITALAVAALAEAAAPYGIEAFDSVLRPLWKGITEYRGKVLASFLKAIGLIIPLMDSYHANYYTKEVMIILINEFNSPDDEMKKIVLKCVKQCIQTEGVDKEYINEEIVNPFFEKFWVMRNSNDKKSFTLIVDTTVEIAKKIGANSVISKIVDDLKDPSEQYRKMVMQTIQNVINELGVDDIDQILEEQLIDGMLYAFQEQTSEDYYILLNSFDIICNKLNIRMKPYLPQIAGILRWRLNTPLPKVRQQSADLISRITKLIKICDEKQMLGHLSLYLYEYLGEEYPEVLANIIKALKSILLVLGVQNMTPPIKDLLPRITPILKNRHEKVQENVIDLIGIIADKGGDLVSPKEWDRICFDLIELLKSNKKLIRRATIQTFGYIARTIGPFEVLTVLLNNLKVQERQLRVCTTVAIAIVADTCLPYSVLAALMNEYKTQDMNVQNGVLKALSFMFEYIGEIAKDYVYSVVTLLEHALMDRDLVHRQIATWACKHLALGCFGLNRQDALIHLLNYVWPNIFETSPHLIQAVIDSIDGFRVALGPAIIFQYLVQGIFHPSRKVREIYWKIYNNVYIGHQDSLVPIYPPFELLNDSTFARDELRYTI
ncbi:splicing factor 3B subunit 1, putative [Plasmodium sp. gorilla clade G3]|nr:splicing factor 3B subunit 1, putative [Plasmodium sp. gorilla clade G3]